jgi:energy-coupling factor transporter ATP-binding protein EcfA2
MQSLRINEYHVFLASPGDVEEERIAVREFFNQFNLRVARNWGVRFEVIDWENYSNIGLGHPQQLITKQTLERFRTSLALMIGIMAQRFGSPTATSESGTEEEFNWAFKAHSETGFPEVKWFFRRIETFHAPSDPTEIEEALDQWNKVLAFKKRLKNQDPPLYYADYSTPETFSAVLRKDLELWLIDAARPWQELQPASTAVLGNVRVLEATRAYYENLSDSFRRLDIAGIDSDKSFDIPLSEIYVRLRVIFEEDEEVPEVDGDLTGLRDAGAIDIQTALARFRRLAIVGDPGSGKSTFLKFIALVLARCVLIGQDQEARARLSLETPLPVPLFVSCWDLSDFLVVGKRKANRHAFMDFAAMRFSERGWDLAAEEVERLLAAGRCCVLIDGLDEVPTDLGRVLVSRMIEDLVEHYQENRYVVTSRVRAYTGETILKKGFARCDIQPFDFSDRSLFLQNWVSVLFRVPIEKALMEATPSRIEHTSLVQAIEMNPAIQTLAVNPLLLTVIAIVHWNRKRLPEQRVELYDECVDVLLGQRKEAELNQQTKSADTLALESEDARYEDRTWRRKRFAEIALEILSGDDEEISKKRVLDILRPRFQDRDGLTEEQAESRAARFLSREELKSGLLVSRRLQSYRFVHLTFLEYLAAWSLANRDIRSVTDVIVPNLREQRWFETLQLLGGELARMSDELHNGYIEFLLSHVGTSIEEMATIVALCANIVRDTSGVADLNPTNRRNYESAVKQTLDVFNPNNAVGKAVQLEILAALASLGAAVKEHLISATRSGLLEVRSHAVTMLVPHLSDDDLFGMTHLLKDRSREPIKSYLVATLERDRGRAIALLLSQDAFPHRCLAALAQLIPLLMPDLNMAWFLSRFEPLVLSAPYGSEEDSAAMIVRGMARSLSDEPSVRRFLERAEKGAKSLYVRRNAVVGRHGWY